MYEIGSKLYRRIIITPIDNNLYVLLFLRFVFFCFERNFIFSLLDNKQSGCNEAPYFCELKSFSLSAITKFTIGLDDVFSSR